MPAQPDFSYTYTFVAGAGVNDLYTGTVSCQLKTRPQIDSVTPDTDYVFVTMGGNDIGFSTIVVNCLTLRDPSSCKQALDAATAKAPQMVERTKDALRAVEQRSGGHAQVYLLSYPFLIKTESYGIPEAAPVYDAGTALNDLQRLGDDLQARGIAELNAEPDADNYHFVDTVKAAWGGRVHGLDPHVVADNSKAWLVPVGAPGPRHRRVRPPDPARLGRDRRSPPGRRHRLSWGRSGPDRGRDAVGEDLRRIGERPRQTGCVPGGRPRRTGVEDVVGGIPLALEDGRCAAMPAAARASRRRARPSSVLLLARIGAPVIAAKTPPGGSRRDGHRRAGAQPGVDLDDLVAQGEGLRADALTHEPTVDGVGLETRGGGIGGPGQRREDRRRLAGKCPASKDVGLADRVVGQTDRDVDADDTDAGGLAHHGHEVGDRRCHEDARPGCTGLQAAPRPSRRRSRRRRAPARRARPVRACRPSRRRRAFDRGGPRGRRRAATLTATAVLTSSSAALESPADSSSASSRTRRCSSSSMGTLNRIPSGGFG